MPITDTQLIRIVKYMFNDSEIEPEKLTILTNNHRVLFTIAELYQSKNYELTNVYFVTEDKEIATDIYINFESEERLPIDNVYVAPLNEFVKEFKRCFNRILFDFDGISYEALDEISNTITHGAKDECVTCITSPCDGVGEEAIEKINDLIGKMSEVFDSDLPDTRKLYILMNHISLTSASTSWIVSPERTKLADDMKELLERPRYLSAPDGGETPFLGTKSHAMLSFLVRRLSALNMLTKSFQIPRAFFFIDDGKTSTGVGLILIRR